VGPLSRLVCCLTLLLAPSLARAEDAAGGAAPLPSWWKLGFEMRGRADNYSGLNCVPGSADSFYLQRIRLETTITPKDWLRFFTQVQDSRAFGYSRRPVPGNVADHADLRQSYVEIGAEADRGFVLRVGRQPLIFGDKRLVSTSNWSNVGAGYDAVRLTWHARHARLDAFASLPVVTGLGFDRPRFDRKLSGLYSSFDLPQARGVLDVYTLWKSNQANHVNILIYGVRGAGKLAWGFDYDVETALQHGRIAYQPHSAWLGHWESGHRLGGTPRAPRVWLEYNYATGGRGHTFEQLYPSPVNTMGRATEFASRNLHEPLAGMEWQAWRRWKLRATYRHFWLADLREALYSTTGSVFARSAAAVHGHVGGETGGWAIWQATRHFQLWLGCAHLSPGAYLREAGRPAAITYPYAMWTYTL
jgi:hypothetical protein